mmetsp:Transcript_24394/g.48809  ORF Transcript_24394/g.48809 Transcript_24394/m.48809 type:complete len:152 (+) Transcript_24394:560-1015(+)
MLAATNDTLRQRILGHTEAGAQLRLRKQCGSTEGYDYKGFNERMRALDVGKIEIHKTSPDYPAVDFYVIRPLSSGAMIEPTADRSSSHGWPTQRRRSKRTHRNEWKQRLAGTRRMCGKHVDLCWWSVLKSRRKLSPHLQTKTHTQGVGTSG